MIYIDKNNAFEQDTHAQTQYQVTQHVVECCLDSFSQKLYLALSRDVVHTSADQTLVSAELFFPSSSEHFQTPQAQMSRLRHLA